MWMGILTISTGEMACSNVGHEYPAILRAGDKEGGGFVFHKVPHSPPIGAFKGVPFCSEDLVLKAGDVIFVYTDGVTEAHRGETSFSGMTGSGQRWINLLFFVVKNPELWYNFLNYI